jgi:hypothetical protein
MCGRAVTGDITVTTGGTTVEVEELRAAGQRLDRLAIAASAAGSRLSALESEASGAWLQSHQAPPEALRAHSALSRARTDLAVVEFQARTLGMLVGYVADGYSVAERVVHVGMGAVADEVGALLGTIARLFVPVAVATSGEWLPGAALVAGAFSMFGVRIDVNRLLSTPMAVDMARLGVRASDDAVFAAVGVPHPLVSIFGDGGLGLLGAPAAATAAAGVGSRLGMLRESPVRIESTTALPLRPPVAGFADRLDRIPDPAKLDGAQVVVERYENAQGESRFEVYIAGTVDFDFHATDEPWDFTSNVWNMVGDDSGSVDSVRAALADAGVGPDDPVQFTGHSQGGAVGARLAASGEYATAGLVTFGGPTGQIEVPADIPTVFVEHTDDVVVGAGGEQENEHAVVVRRRAAEDVDFDNAEFLPAHRRPAYAETATAMDASRDARLVDARARIDSFTDGSVLVERTAYHCVRVESTPLAPAAPDERATGWAATSSSAGAAGSRSAS